MVMAEEEAGEREERRSVRGPRDSDEVQKTTVRRAIDVMCVVAQKAKGGADGSAEEHPILTPGRPTLGARNCRDQCPLKAQKTARCEVAAAVAWARPGLEGARVSGLGTWMSASVHHDHVAEEAEVYGRNEVRDGGGEPNVAVAVSAHGQHGVVV